MTKMIRTKYTSTKIKQKYETEKLKKFINDKISKFKLQFNPDKCTHIHVG
jgi:hypothetical protein